MRHKQYVITKENKICVDCQKAVAVKNKTMCQACLDKKSSYMRSYYKKNHETVREGNRFSLKKRYYTHKAAGLCVRCDNVAIPGKTICKECQATLKKLYIRRKEANKDEAESKG